MTMSFTWLIDLLLNSVDFELIRRICFADMVVGLGDSVEVSTGDDTFTDDGEPLVINNIEDGEDNDDNDVFYAESHGVPNNFHGSLENGNYSGEGGEGGREGNGTGWFAASNTDKSCVSSCNYEIKWQVASKLKCYL